MSVHLVGGGATTVSDAALYAPFVAEAALRARAANRERPRIAGVFTTRLRRNMRLQTDPTVIYGIGASYDGNIRERDLRADTPYNTYTRGGLPPTPIALPSREAIEAATHPLETGDIFFVATGIGDGSHVFSATLEEHNAAVKQYLARLRSNRLNARP